MEPEVIELRHPRGLSESAKRMQIPTAETTPILEPDGNLEGRGALPHELSLIDAEQVMKCDDRRYGGFADADRTDLFGFDERNVEQCAEMLRERHCGHPAGGAAACNDDFLDRAWSDFIVLHGWPLSTAQPASSSSP